MADRPLTAAQALALAKAVADIYSDATAQLLTVIAGRLARDTRSPEWAQRRLADILPLRANAQRIVAAMQRHGADRVAALLEDAYRGGSLTAATGDRGLVATNQRAVLALAAETTRLVESTHPRMLRWTEDVYRSTIADAAAPGVTTGTTTRLEASQRALDRFATEGVTGFTDKAGRNWRLESYVEMATRTAAGRAFLTGTADRLVTNGRDLVIVSNSPEECPLCRPWEGKVLSLTGATPVGADAGDGVTVAGTHAQAVEAGLHHPNCTHSIGAYIPGLTKPMGDTENPQGYEDRQTQRGLEVDVRTAKRRLAAQKALEDGYVRQYGRIKTGDPYGAAIVKRRLKAQEQLTQARGDLDQFVKEAGRKAEVSRRRTSTRRAI